MNDRESLNRATRPTVPETNSLVIAAIASDGTLGTSAFDNDRETHLYPSVQRGDGSYVGDLYSYSYTEGSHFSMAAFAPGGEMIWTVPGSYSPQIATADGGVIASQWVGDSHVFATFDANGQATGQLRSVPIQGWKESSYQLGSVESIIAPLIGWASTHWPVGNANASGSGTAFKIPQFRLNWCSGNNCSPNDAVAFVYYQDNPTIQLSTQITLPSSSVQVIKQNALKALRQAFQFYPVNVAEGSDGANTVDITGSNAPYIGGSVACGTTAQRGISIISTEYYLALMQNAQWALSVQTATPNDSLITGIGVGVGTIAAHEIAHQLGVPEGTTPGTYAYGPCDDSASYTGKTVDGLLIHWSSSAAQQLTRRILGQPE